MIEVIYNQEEQRSNSKEIPIKLPRNIRQIGSPNPYHRIYIEDYVITYLNKLALPSNTYSRGAILLGTYKKAEDYQVLFISGAVEAQNLELDLDETVFTNATWSHIYEGIKNYFPELEVVGWFLSRMGFSVEINEKILKTHLDNFPGVDKTLYMIDSLENEDAFYLFEQGGLRRQAGYYVYYEKNEAMQSYLLSQKETEQDNEEEAGGKIIERDQALLKSYREAMEKRQDKRENKGVVGILYSISCLLTIAILAIGITIINNYDKMKDMEGAMSHLVEYFKEEKEYIAEDKEIETVIVRSNLTTEQETTTKEIEEETKETAQTVPAMSQGVATYYTVKEGDTLMSISKKMYHSTRYVELIKKANEITDENKIFPGDKIVIPSVE
ncbi:MAG: LysM domain-containing protein [Lachnospiraceae bacterium]|nr:LysM domain-containing protein [Lachnospiraceae bacterium]